MESCYISIIGSITALLVLVLTGCVAPINYQTAVPQLPFGMAGKLHKDIIEINLPELTLLAEVQAFDWGGQYLLPPLGVWIDIKPIGGVVTLNTTQVTLKSDEDAPISAISYLGPGTKWFSPRALAAGCGPRMYRTGIGLTRIGVSQESVRNADNDVGIYRPSETPIAIEKDSCFMFWFDTDSLPDHTFVLSIQGLKRSGKEIAIPNIRFQEGTVNEIRGFP